ncbi:MAG: hypothetical protein QNJ12_03620 [Ilumatobacter sp.]|uniref:hypothetical protein n=1 Tax=Ilumatobacter sp. TaxID=1967498 RepID=UPI00261DC6C6|nr:hypothetical protein [Ilumatobacter sp.]MDJ0767851.1 hypothetical protein [Ilumatobacter sp.]
MTAWILLGIVLFAVGAESFRRAGRLGEYVVLYRTPRNRADADRALMTVTGFRIIFSLLASAGVFCVLGGIALA